MNWLTVSVARLSLPKKDVFLVLYTGSLRRVLIEAYCALSSRAAGLSCCRCPESELLRKLLIMLEINPGL